MEDLTQKSLKQLLDYNPDTGDFVWKVTIGKRAQAGSVAGSYTGWGYQCIRVKGRLYLSHRLAWFLIYGEFPPAQIDHINHIRDDNRLCNLRVVTHAENQQNQQPYVNNTSGVTGVSWAKQRNKWVAQISILGKVTYLGIYPDWFDAVCARKSAENQHGFHANHGRKLCESL